MDGEVPATQLRIVSGETGIAGGGASIELKTFGGENQQPANGRDFGP